MMPGSRSRARPAWCGCATRGWRCCRRGRAASRPSPTSPRPPSPSPPGPPASGPRRRSSTGGITLGPQQVRRGGVLIAYRIIRLSCVLGYYSLINFNDQNQRLFYLPSTECHNRGEDFVADVIDVIKSEKFSEEDIQIKLSNLSTARCRQYLETAQVEDTTVNINVMENDNSKSWPRIKPTSTTPITTTLTSTTLTKRKSTMLSISTTTSAMTTTASTTRKLISTKEPDVNLRSNILVIDVDEIVLILLITCVILFSIVLCCCLSHLPCSQKYFCFMQRRNDLYPLSSIHDRCMISRETLELIQNLSDNERSQGNKK